VKVKSDEIQPYRDEMVPAVRAFNQRLREHGIRHRFPETAQSLTLPALPGRSIYQEYFLACDGDTVHGGYVLKRQQLALDGAILPVGNYQFPLSEGIIDPRHVSLGMRFLRHAVRKQPLLYTLGLGGHDEAIARLLKAAGWTLGDVPFYFKVFHAGRFLRNLNKLRSTRLRRLAADTLALTGLGSLGLFLVERVANPTRARPDSAIACQRVGSFGSWADELWRRCLGRYRMMTVRDRATLEVLYPAEQARLIRLRLTRGQTTVGWAVLLDTRMVANKYFGDMRVGTLVDCLALPDHAEAVVLASMNELGAAGCDIAISNQLHRAWCRVLERCGFWAGPSNFLIGFSPQLAQKLRPLDLNQLHINRGDGDGPYNL
jgi:hypothetical protein